MRIGQSSDIHAFVRGKDLVLGGVHIPYEFGLLAHSDGDALTHAIIEAIIGAMGLKDIGTHFPDNDPKYKDICSLNLLDETYKLMNKEGYELANLDSLVLIETPKLAPYIDKMRENIACHLHCDTSQINVKATRGEGLGFVGKKEGVMAQCVCLLEKVRNE